MGRSETLEQARAAEYKRWVRALFVLAAIDEPPADVIGEIAGYVELARKQGQEDAKAEVAALRAALESFDEWAENHEGIWVYRADGVSNLADDEGWIELYEAARRALAGEGQ